jgi:uncharacterized protein YbjT (DUF2867 family)
VYGAGGNPVSFVSYKDVAKFAVEAVELAAAENRAVDVCGPEPVTQLDAVRIFERAAGRDFARQHVAEETLQENWRRATDPLELTFASLILDYAAGSVANPAEMLRIVPLQLTTVGDYAKQAMAARR